MKYLIKENYEVTREKGLITDKTTTKEFMVKILEEYRELDFELAFGKTYKSIYELNNRFKLAKESIKYEIADIILVCLNFAHHLDIDIEKVLKEKIEINRQRI